MKKRLLPVPLILLIPIVLLIIVSVAGVYRFSLSDEEILAKFPSQVSQTDPVMQTVFSIKTANPWTVKIPESSAFTFIDDMEQLPIVKGTYEDGAERGVVSTNTDFNIQVNETTYVSPFAVSNQGSGTFYYLVVSKYDEFRQRMVTKGATYLGDRIRVQELSVGGSMVTVKLLERDEHQAMSEEPSKLTTILFKVTEQDSLEKQ
ncbi:hypothetical protein [Vibrio bivalvicida]|uniref:Uncharacterized protein n=1 Tax=Vibrio bivalvicida TaxID=1276888 RepID=A0ABV4MHF3_9VIBR